MKTSKLTYIALLSSAAIIFGYIESLFPAVTTIPGIKLGISNIVILFALLRADKVSAFFVMLIKVCVSSLLFSGLNVLIYSLCGGIFSLLAMIAFKKLKFSVIGISMLGSIFHNIGQLFAASLMLGTLSVFSYLPVLLISGLALGFVTGTVCRIIVSRTDIV